MPFVHIIMEPRDEETKHRIGREIADAMAEGTNNSLDGIQMIFHDVPRPDYVRGLVHAAKRPRSTETPKRAEHVTIARLRMEDEAAYVAFRRDHTNPALARQAGFVSTTLLRLGGGEYMLLNKWQSENDARAWSDSSEHAEIEKLARQVKGYERVEAKGAALVHQQFGPSGGKVLDGSPAAARQALAAGRA
jgi:heme-degrading monooxygenase HmoA/phenylpyruvate tautomerase PptA (4-oxalocrotonate tautomerase family)